MSQQPIVSVRGSAQLAVEPETAVVHVSVLVRDKSRERAEARLVELSATIGEAIEKHGAALRRNHAGSVSVYPVMRTRKTDKPESFEGRRTWTVDVRDFDALPEILGDLTVSDAVQIHGPTWKLETGSPVYQRARVAAVADAVERARAYAAAFGASIDQLLEVADLGVATDGAAVQGFAGQTTMRGSASGGAPAIEQIDMEPATQYVNGGIEARFTMTAPDLDAPTRS